MCTASKNERAEKALDQRARRAAKAASMIAIKSRAGLGTTGNYGGFMLIWQHTGTVEAGIGFSMSAAEVIEYCKDE